jgi:hypothetical protein
MHLLDDPRVSELRLSATLAKVQADHGMYTSTQKTSCTGKKLYKINSQSDETSEFFTSE